MKEPTDSSFMKDKQVDIPSTSPDSTPHHQNVPTSQNQSKAKGLSFHLIWILILLLLVSIISTTSLWQKLGRIQAQLAKQNQQATEISQEAKLIAKTSNEVSQDVLAKQALLEAKINELASQKAQIDELMQTVSRSRVESLVIDIESSLNLAQQQTALTGSVEPMIMTLQTALQRVNRSPSPRLAGLEAAMRRDLDRVKSINTLDTPSMLIKLDDANQLVQEMPLVNSIRPSKDATQGSHQGLTHPSLNLQTASNKVKASSSQVASSSAGNNDSNAWYFFDWNNKWLQVKNQLASLVRISTISQPEAALLTPEQAFFVRENLSLYLLNARMAMLSRQFQLASADLNKALDLIQRYFDPNSKQTQVCITLLTQINAQVKTGKLPTVTESLNASSALLGSK